MAPIVGLVHDAICHAYLGLSGSGGGGVSFSAFLVISCMSAPAVKALSPDPVIIIAPISSSCSKSVMAVSSSLYRIVLSALSTSGLFNVRVAMPSDCRQVLFRSSI